MTVILVLVLVSVIFASLVSEREELSLIPISEVAQKISNDEVEKIALQGEELLITLKTGEEEKSKKEPEASLSESLVNYGVSPEKLQTVPIEVTSSYGWSFWFLTIFPIVLPILFVIFLFWLISRQMKGASMQAFSFGQSRARLIDPNDTSQRVTFKNVAGVREAKEELLEIVDFLRSPKKFLDIGARIPKGVILVGAPGTGKTLLARAVAGEAKVPFMYLSGSEFVEMFVGVGASRVRDLFKMAKKVAPSIIFIDEIDAIGRHRGSGLGGGNDEREQTLNQILVEMDGFEPSEKVIIMAATNRPDVLDPALLRPGRFDRRIILDQPDKRDREEILAIHAVKKPLGEDVNLKVVAERTPGFSGADLSNLMNEAAILAARENRRTITQYDLLRSVEKVMLGPERKSHILSVREKKITAYHEVGHALISSLLTYSDPVHKVSIIARGQAAGYTLKLPFEDRRLKSRNEFLDDIAVSLGGYVTEKLIFNDVTTGASNDIQVATALARDMVTKYGMSDELGPVALDSFSHTNLNAGLINERSISEKTFSEIDKEVSKIMNEAKKRAEDVIVKHKTALDNLADELMKMETLEREDFEKLLIVNGIKPKSEPEKEVEVFAPDSVRGE
ncbi:MAG TPA: ATP-dependent zinc metalloprotease FtsH [Candidatus Paceibacterota bacterium]|nr:ATP-dependent zinc metalloprotease FtsH [Candidatus Paceibacterota bacterium]HOH11593.1 ATP-dependent zinc metalloprotease FtsH [Candidatus Paceibacterota bacterium]